MSLETLPIEIKYKLLEKCPQLRFIFTELRNELKNFIKPDKLDYPYQFNKHRKIEIITYNNLQLEFRSKNMECISSCGGISCIECLAFHKILPFLFVGYNDGFIKIFSLDNDFKINNIIKFIKGHNDIVLSLTFHNLELIFASSSVDFTIKFWKFNKNCTKVEHIITITEKKCYLKKILFHPFLSIFASANHDGKVKLWTIDINILKNIKCVSTLQVNNYSTNTFDFHLTKPLLVTGGYDHEIKIWLLNQTGTDGDLLFRLRGHRHIIQAVKFHESAPYLVSGGYDSSVKLWLFNENYTNAECIASLYTNSPVCTISLHKSGLIACGTQNDLIKLWQLDEKNSNAVYKNTIDNYNNIITNKKSYISYLEFHNDTENIILASSGDKYFRLWR